jgi:GH25 family lysozyme M1 (1,4-beta-N-acetylmuramidase)
MGLSLANRNFVDLSSNNGPQALDAKAYAEAGHVLVAVKATEGLDYVNPDWAAQVHAAHEAGVSVLHYHFAQPGDPGPQASFFLDHLARSGEFHSYDSIALDVERGQRVPDPAVFVGGFDSQCASLGHGPLVVYTELSYHKEHGLAPAGGRLWIADYGVGFINGYWADQYADAAEVHGIEGECDVSRLSLAAYLYHRTHRP